MEVCVDSLESTIAAYEGGAKRVELCSSLNEGGLTPSFGLVRSVQKYLSSQRQQDGEEKNFEINCMIRCRSGDFVYDDHEMEQMEEDAKKFVELDVNGLVFGALTPQVVKISISIFILSSHINSFVVVVV